MNTGKTRHRDSLRALLVLVVCTSMLSGCSQTKSFLNSVKRPKSSGGSDPVLGAPAAEDYIDELGLLSSNDPAAQAEIIADSRAAAQLTPNPSTRLRYALVLATPGHPESNANEAQSLLRDVLAESELMTGYEVALAQIYLTSVEQQLVRESEVRRLRASTSRAQQSETAALNQRLEQAQAENRELRRELAEAEEKLEAITSIERSIREQEGE